jgi:ketosteroid isomerase-like protein
MGPCGVENAGLKELLETEYAFAKAARDSFRTAFLEYLAEDSLVLQPGPTSGQAFYRASAEPSGTLAWYPALADVAGSEDLGFTTGPWIYAGASGTASHGHFLSIWKRDAACRWRVEVDGGVSHAAPASDEPELVPGEAQVPVRSAPPPSLIAQGAASRAISDFQQAAEQDDVAAGLRTYARTIDFRFYTEGLAPMGLASANQYLTGQDFRARHETLQGRSADSTFAYCLGVVGASASSRHAYVQIWQYDPRVANWGLRILLLNPLSA